MLTRRAVVTLPRKIGCTPRLFEMSISEFEWNRPSISSSWICTFESQRSTNCAKLENASRCMRISVDQRRPSLSVLTSTIMWSMPMLSPAASRVNFAL